MNKKVRSIILAIQEKFNRFDSSVKNPRYCEKPMNNPPIFIIGPPRSGSTMLFQWLIIQFELSYISNLLALFPSQMVKLCRIIPKVANGRRKEISRSEFGYVPGIIGPNEAGGIMRKWFEDSNLNIENKYIRRTITEISSITNSPLLIKNLHNTMRLENIMSIIPESRFIYLHRDPLFTAQSILSSRLKLYGSYDDWFGFKPPGYRSILERNPFEQVIWQITTTNNICNEIKKKIPQKFYKLRYESFCQSPQKYLDKIKDFFNIKKRENAPLLKETLFISNKVKLEPDDWQKLVTAQKSIKHKS